MLNSNILATLGGLYLFLGITSLLVARFSHSLELRLRLRSWWFMVIVFSLAFFSNRTVLILLVAFISFLALKEYLSIIPTRRVDRRLLFWAYLSIPVQYLFVYYQNYGMFIILVPVYMLLFLPMIMVLVGETNGFLKAIGTIQWGLMLTVFCLGHLAFLVVLPPAHDTGLGLLFFVLLLTQFNDVAQFLWGKRFGKHKILPKISPNKTVEGLLGGILTTTFLSFLLSPVLTPMSWWLALSVGFFLAIIGFIGDVTISALKRDLGVKDSSTLIPGHGGILDRVDSLIYTAPLFFHIIRFVFYLPY